MELFSAQKFDFEDKRCVGGNHTPGTTGTIAQLRWNGQFALAAHLHTDHALVPTLNDHTLAQREYERIVTILARIKLLPIRQPAGVMHGHHLTGLCLGT